MEKLKKKPSLKGFLSLIIKGIAILILLSFILGFISVMISNFYPSSTSQSTQTSMISQSNLQTVQSILQEYHQTHTYSQPDFFVCSDMAIDVWNMVKSKGINAKIEVGNIDDPNVNFTEFNHAWVLAEIEPFTWLALETTGGYVVYNETNCLYYKGFSFNTPQEFKRYLEIRNDYNSQLETINETENEYNQCKDEYNQLSSYYNQNYAEKPVTSDSIQARDNTEQKLGECNAINNRGMEEIQTLSNIINELKGLVT